MGGDFEEILFKIAKNWEKTQVYIISECIKRKYKTWKNNQQFTCNKMDDSYKHDIKWEKKKNRKNMLYDSIDVAF